MCFRFGSCLGGGGGQDYGRFTPRTSRRGGPSHMWGQPDHAGHYDHRAPADAYSPGGARRDDRVADDAPGHEASKHPAAWTGFAEARRDGYKAGGARKDDRADDAHDHGYAGDEHPAAWSGKVGDDAGYAYAAAHVNDAAAAAAAADHRENAAADDNRYHPTTTAAATRARYELVR